MINIQDMTARFKSIFNNVCKILNEYHKKMAIDTINELFSKLSSNQTTIMVCGEFKRGKSTFINALLDMSLCPTDEHIATSTVSIIKYGEKQKVTRFYDTEDGVKEEIIEYEKINQFAKGSNLEIDNTIMLVIEVPCNRLKDGLTIIDTPGVGGLNPRHRFLTLSAIPKTDTIFYMVSVGEPITTIELDFLKKDILPKSKAYKNVMAYLNALTCSNEIKEALITWYDHHAKGRVSVQDVENNIKAIYLECNNNTRDILTAIQMSDCRGWFKFYKQGNSYSNSYSNQRTPAATTSSKESYYKESDDYFKDIEEKVKNGEGEIF